MYLLLILGSSHDPPLETWIKVKIRNGEVRDLVIKRGKASFVDDHREMLSYLLNHIVEPQVKGVKKTRGDVYNFIRQDSLFSEALQILRGQKSAPTKKVVIASMLKRSVDFIAHGETGPYLCIYPDSEIRLDHTLLALIKDAFCYHVLHSFKREHSAQFRRAIQDTSLLVDEKGVFALLMKREFNRNANSLPFLLTYQD
jgi:hypothetical protein